jgi:beta-lactamase class A
MIKKPMMALLVLLFALAAVGAGYARWSDTLQVQLDAETGS